MNSSYVILLFVALSVITPVSILRADDKPNLVFILADDLGFSDLGCYGGEIQTPHLDHLAQNGLRYTQFYNTARCWPSRAALLTGYYAQQVNRDPQGTRPAWAALAPQFLKQAGYRSYQSGKWHVDGPILAGGFERSYEIGDHDRFFHPNKLTLNDQPISSPSLDDGYYATTAIADRGIEFLQEHAADHKDKPFFLYLAFTSPHFPLHALPDDIARYANRYQSGWEAVRQERWQRQKQLGLLATNLSDVEKETFPPWNFSESDLRHNVGSDEVGRAVAWNTLSPSQQNFQSTKMAIHAAMVHCMDREIGRVFDQLRAMNAFENSVIFFASDNGASAEQIIRGDMHDR
ncbi:MAG: arylsulfatase, partial [Planctomycetes bacterium]|nr:arylsulfatase [Planctomycetota bacterium]